MELRGLIEDDFINYKLPSMFLIFPHCNFKCCKEAGNDICQNMPIIKDPIITVEADDLIKKYLDNPISKAIVCGGLEPFDSFYDLKEFISKLRWDYECNDPVVIYTGYEPEEIIDQITELVKFANIIVKFGRFIPNQKKHFDEVLGVYLASDNQRAVEL